MLMILWAAGTIDDIRNSSDTFQTETVFFLVFHRSVLFVSHMLFVPHTHYFPLYFVANVMDFAALKKVSAVVKRPSLF